MLPGVRRTARRACGSPGGELLGRGDDLAREGALRDGGRAAVDGEHDARDELGEVAREERGGLRDVIGLPDTSDRLRGAETRGEALRELVGLLQRLADAERHGLRLDVPRLALDGSAD